MIGKTMSDLRIKANIDCGDLPKDFDDGKIELRGRPPNPHEVFHAPRLRDIMNPTKLREWFEKNNGQENK